MATRFTDKEWEDIKRKSTGAYTVDDDAKKADDADKAKLEDELDDEKMRKEQSKRDREERKSAREDRKFAKDNPDSDFAKQYNKAHPKKQSQARSKSATKKVGKGIGKAVGNIGSSLQPGGVPQYTSPSFNIGKSGYTPLDYKPVSGGSTYNPVSDKPYYKPTSGGATYKPKEYKPIFPNKVPMTKASKSRNPKKGGISPITGFMRF
jgi:hypothetical protein